MNFRNISNFISSIFNDKTMDMGYQNNKAIDYLSLMEYYEREKEKRFLSQTGRTSTIIKNSLTYTKNML